MRFIKEIIDIINKTKYSKQGENVVQNLQPTDEKTAEFRAIAYLYHGFFTGIMLTMVTRRGVEDAAEFTYRLFRTKHEEQFLPGTGKARH